MAAPFFGRLELERNKTTHGRCLMKRIFSVLVVAVFTLGLVLIYCPQPASAQDKGKVIELKFNDWGPPGIGIGKIHQQALKMIEERTNGRVKVNAYFSQSLLKYPETFRGVSGGIADISLYVVQPINEVNRILGMPFTGLPGMLKASKIFNEMLKRYPEFNQEFEKSGVKWIAIRSMPANQLHLVKKQVKLPPDLKGMRIIGDPVLTDSFKKVDAAVLQLGPPDWYSALERGVAQGQLVHYAAAHDFKLLELFKYHTHFGDGAAGAAPIGFVVNMKMWNTLPPDIQKTIVDVFDWANEESLKWDVDLVAKAINDVKQMKQTITELTPAEIQVWLDWAKPSNDKLLAEIEAKGIPAKKLFDGYQKVIKEYK
jgi:TRAP-type C4-dicarboxylate transport system substrate-binding protein